MPNHSAYLPQIGDLGRNFQSNKLLACLETLCYKGFFDVGTATLKCGNEEHFMNVLRS
jgi:hypothetical protein